jgi:tetratricopeptide (TPR) repeat protein
MNTGTGQAVSKPDLDLLARQAVQHFENNNWDDALACFNRVAEYRPQDAQVHNYRARTLSRMDRLEEALECLDLALAIDPKNAADLRNRAIVLTKLGRLVEATATYRAALDERPQDPDLLVRYAGVLNQVDRRDEALDSINEAVALMPNDPDILNARVIVLDNLGRYTDALNDIDRMLTLQPNHIDAINNSGMILARLGRFQDALVCYNRSLQEKPDQPQALYNRSLIRLALGDWIRGFQEFESRWNTPPLNRARLIGLGPLWLGGDEDLTHKTLLLYHEQGYGDTFQCVRYVPLLAARGARVILAVPPALASLMRSLPGVTKVIAGAQSLADHDYQCPLMSLPLAFRTTPDTVPANVPYLQADKFKAAVWAQTLGESSCLRVGLVWGGRRYAQVQFAAGEEIITYVARNLEPYRGFPSFMRSLPRILNARPKARVIIVGGDDVSYGARLPPGQTFRQNMLTELAGSIDLSRVHFLGKIPYAAFIKVLQVSRVHVYLTYPFVLSWSMLEAMAAGCLVIGSRTQPVQEVIQHAANGLLVDFFSPDQIADRVIDALEDARSFASLRQNARQTIIDRFDLKSICLPAHLRLLNMLVARGERASLAPARTIAAR